MNNQKLGNQEAWDRVDLSAPKKRATIFINETLLRECKAQAALEGYSFSEIAEMSLELYLSQLAYSGEEAAGLKKSILKIKKARGKK